MIYSLGSEALSQYKTITVKDKFKVYLTDFNCLYEFRQYLIDKYKYAGQPEEDLKYALKFKTREGEIIWVLIANDPNYPLHFLSEILTILDNNNQSLTFKNKNHDVYYASKAMTELWLYVHAAMPNNFKAYLEGANFLTLVCNSPTVGFYLDIAANYREFVVNKYNVANKEVTSDIRAIIRGDWYLGSVIGNSEILSSYDWHKEIEKEDGILLSKATDADLMEYVYNTVIRAAVFVNEGTKKTYEYKSSAELYNSGLSFIASNPILPSSTTIRALSLVPYLNNMFSIDNFRKHYDSIKLELIPAYKDSRNKDTLVY